MVIQNSLASQHGVWKYTQFSFLMVKGSNICELYLTTKVSNSYKHFGKPESNK